MRACLLLLGLLVCSAHASKMSDAFEKRAENFQHNVEVTVQSVAETMQKIGQHVQEQYASVLKGSKLGSIIDGADNKRRLLTLGAGMQNVQGFLGDMLGGSWKDFVPTSWSNPSFDWSHLGEFDYSSNLGDFMDSADLKNVTDIRSIKDLHKSVEVMESGFCTPEEFTKSEKVPASCVGPSVTIAVTPKTCVLEAHTKQIVCEPAKLVLTKVPSSCTHKYKSASVWVGKECKISGEAGFTDEVVIGGGLKSIPLTQIDIGYEAK